jgi:hypothetical protein
LVVVLAMMILIINPLPSALPFFTPFRPSLIRSGGGGWW